jgi:hypothetical protein
MAPPAQDHEQVRDGDFFLDEARSSGNEPGIGSIKSVLLWHMDWKTAG